MNDDPNPLGDPQPGTPHLPPTGPDTTGPDTTGPDTTPGAAPVTSQAPAAAPASPLAAAPGVRIQNRIAIIVTVAVLVVAVAGGAYLLGRGDAGGEDPVAGVGATPTASVTVDPSTPAATPAAPDPLAGLPTEGNRLGRADAEVEIEYWSDFQCPFCAKFAQERIPQLVPLIADGTIAIVHRDFAFIGPESFDASLAVRCAGREGRYWAMHDAVFAAQDGENQGAFARDRLVAIGERVGIEAATMEACFDDRELLVGILTDTSAAVRTAVQSTPTVDVNGTRFLGVPEEGEIEAAVAAAIAGASPQPLPTMRPIQDPWSQLGAAGREAGPAGAPVTVDLWMDYASPDAAVVARELSEPLRARVESGAIRVVLHDLALLGAESELAGTALRCIDAQDGPTWLIHDILSVSGQGAGAEIYTTENLLRLGAQLGLDITELDACLGDDAVARAVRDETATGQGLGLATSPAIIVMRGDRERGRFEGSIDSAKVLAAIGGGG